MFDINLHKILAMRHPRRQVLAGCVASSVVSFFFFLPYTLNATFNVFVSFLSIQWSKQFVGDDTYIVFFGMGCT